MTDPATLLDLRARIRSCTRCPLSADTTPIPWSGPLHPPLAILGQAPGFNEVKQGKPFVGRAGKLLRQLIGEAGIDPDSCAYANSICCHPGAGSDGHDNPPSAAHLHACRTHLLDQIAVIQPFVLLLAGQVALSTLRPDLKLSQARGWPLWVDTANLGRAVSPFIAIASYHPSAGFKSARAYNLLAHDLKRIGEVGTDRGAWLDRWLDECYLCGGEPDQTDGWGVLTCDGCAVGKPEKTPSLF